MTDSPEIARTLKLHPVDELPVAYGKLKECSDKDLKFQADSFCKRFVFFLKEDGVRKVYFLRDLFQNALDNQKSTTIPSQAEKKPSSEQDEEETTGKKKSSFYAGRVGSMVSFHLFGRRTSKVMSKIQLQSEYELSLNSTAFTWFLEQSKKPMAQLHRRAAFSGVLTEAGGISLIGYLLYHFRRKILLEYYSRRNKAATKSILSLQCGKSLGNEEIGFEESILGNKKTVGEALVEEMFLTHPLGVDGILDAGMSQFSEFVFPLKRSILHLEQILNDDEMNLVTKTTSKSELTGVKKDYNEAYQVSFTKMKSRLEKVKKQQNEAFENIKRRVNGKVKYRQMTLVKV